MYYNGKNLAMLFYKKGDKEGLIGITEIDQPNGKFFVTNGYMGVYMLEKEVISFINKWNSYSSRIDIPLERFKKERDICLEHELISNKRLTDEVLLNDIPKHSVTLTPFIDQVDSRIVYTKDFLIIADNDYIEFLKSIRIDIVTAASFSALYFFSNEEPVGFVMPKSLKRDDKIRIEKIIKEISTKNIINVEKD